MNPTLIVIAGSLKGMIFALTDEEVSIGREASNLVSLSDPSVSRRHCLIKWEGDQYKIVDLGSYNSTFVNGVPVNEQTLAHGDQIAIGDILLLFILHEAETDTAPALVQLDEGDLITRSTIRLQREEALYLRPEKVLAALPTAARMARDLSALLKISTTINSLQGLEAIQRQLLELVFEAIPAERGAILLVDKKLEGFTSVYGWNKLLGLENVVHVSRTITNQVLREGIALLSNDIVENKTLAEAPSLVTSHVRSLLCVPLVVFEKVLGVIYLDTSEPTVRFDEEHLQLLTAIAGITAIALENAGQIEWLEDENKRLNQEIHLEHQMIGESPQIREVYRLIAKVAPADSTILIRGESGTGKELVAHAIHLNSPRTGKPFLAINCATLTENLLESELFGHEKGAFTGAIVQKRGKLEIVDGGTLFLDEIGELSPTIQAKLLRVLQEREFERVGGTRSIKVDARILAATNRDLETAIRDGSFRQDLYYRLNVVSFTMPPLRERREDISLLASYFAMKCSQKSKRRVTGISAEARSYLMNYNWPGNVRELENAIERAVVLGETERILPEDLPESVLDMASATISHQPKYYEAVKETKKQLIFNAIKQANSNYTEAAKLLGIHPNNLHRLIRNMNLRIELSK
jgi:Nif-specific regulatory protein